MPPYDTGQKRILVVDDDRAILELVCTRLTLAGFDAFTARDGYDALAKLSSLRPVAMVLDLNMPGLDGFGVLQRMGKTGLARTPTLVLTASHAATDVQRAVQLGARDYLAKPFKDNHLLMRVSRLVRPPAQRLDIAETLDSIDQMIG